jgi:hypothetical protein
MIHKLADVLFCVIMKNIEISVCSVVTNDIGKNQLWYGNPATHIGYVCKCRKKSD